MTDAMRALGFVWKHGKGALCECGKEDAPCLGCQAIKILKSAIAPVETTTLEGIGKVPASWVNKTRAPVTNASEDVREAVEAFRFLNEGDTNEAIGKAFCEAWDEHGVTLLSLVDKQDDGWFKCDECEKRLPTENGLSKHKRYHAALKQRQPESLTVSQFCGAIVGNNIPASFTEFYCLLLENNLRIVPDNAREEV